MKDIQENFDRILFPQAGEPDKITNDNKEQEEELNVVTTNDEEYCPQCDRGDFCSKHAA
jgi:hypothetical protein